MRFFLHLCRQSTRTHKSLRWVSFIQHLSKLQE